MTIPYVKYNPKKDLYELKIQVNDLKPIQRCANSFWGIDRTTNWHQLELIHLFHLKFLLKFCRFVF
jgi:hypothetical protein